MTRVTQVLWLPTPVENPRPWLPPPPPSLAAQSEQSLALHRDLWDPNPRWEQAGWALYPSTPTERILKTSITCKQDIRFCQKHQKRLEVFLHSLSLSCCSLSGFICSFQSEAGRDGSGGDPGLRQGQQQAQGPQRRLPPGPPSGHGLPSTHCVSTPPNFPLHLRAPAPDTQPDPSEVLAAKLQAAPSTYFLWKACVRGTVAKLGPLPPSLCDTIGTNSAGRLVGALNL